MPKHVAVLMGGQPEPPPGHILFHLHPSLRMRARRAGVGIDVSKDRLDVHVRPQGTLSATGRDDLAELIEALRQLDPARIVVEATGGYETWVASALAAAQLPLAVVNPRRIRDFAKAVGKLAKTDRLDAAIIAHFAEAVRPQPRPVAAAEAVALCEHVTRRRQVIEMMVAERNRARRVHPTRIQKAIERHLAVLQAELSEIDHDIDEAIRQSPVWQAEAGLLESVPGIGKATTRVLIAEFRNSARSAAVRLLLSPGLRRSTTPAARKRDAAPSPGQTGGARRSLYGGFGREPLQSCDRSPLPETPRRRENRQAGPDRLHAQAPRHSHCHAA